MLLCGAHLREVAAASLVVDAETGTVISADASNHLWYPASLTKMMMVYLALAEIKAGRLAFESEIRVSDHAAHVSPVRFGLEPGQTITVRQAINAAIVASANDAAVALAERIGGTEDKFAKLMTLKARDLGMARTVFRNATGLPDDGQVTTAHDMAILALALLRDYPKQYALFNQRSVAIGGKSRGTVNGILGAYEGADGFKTGFTCGSGYNLVASAERGKRRVIGIVLGSRSREQRLAEMTRLLDSAFADRKSLKLPLGELLATAADEGAPPIVLGGSVCAAEGNGENLVKSSARAGGWGIVFGSFLEKRKAQAALKDARKQIGALANGGRPVIALKQYNGVKQHSAMIVGLTQARAGKACKAMWAKKLYCLALSPVALGNPGMAWR